MRLGNGKEVNEAIGQGHAGNRTSQRREQEQREHFPDLPAPDQAVQNQRETRQMRDNQCEVYNLMKQRKLGIYFTQVAPSKPL